MKQPLYLISTFCSSLLLLFCFLLPFFYSNEIQEIIFINTEEGERLFPPYGPSPQHWLGTDIIGRDLFHQLVIYGKNTLIVVFTIVVLRFSIALCIGFVVKNKKGVLYWLMEKAHHYLSALPILFLVILFMNLAIVEVSPWRMIFIIAFIVLIEVGRLSYIFSNEIHSYYQQPYYEASKMIGSTFWLRLRKYDIRNIGPSIVILFMLELSKVMLLLGQLGFLSMFISQEYFTMEAGPVEVQNRFGTWGSMLADTRDHIRDEFWIPLAPIGAITFAMFTFQLCAESLKKYFSNLKS
ncbi:ABC transporter permease [Evansella sp. AB-rgal1]|uniref:ABC transporter permease n=1 Tax=Evansella sp. AB-rgal1 TaxID=3242696 RepID=UPI00359CF3D2